MDLNRLLRARAARHYEAIERRRRMFLDKKVTELDADEWATVVEMDQVVGEGN